MADSNTKCSLGLIVSEMTESEAQEVVMILSVSLSGLDDPTLSEIDESTTEPIPGLSRFLSIRERLRRFNLIV